VSEGSALNTQIIDAIAKRNAAAKVKASSTASVFLLDGRRLYVEEASRYAVEILHSTGC